MLIYEIFAPRTVKEAFPVKGLQPVARRPAPAAAPVLPAPSRPLGPVRPTPTNDPNVIDVDAKVVPDWTPTNPNVGPGGSREAQAWRAQQDALKTAPQTAAAADTPAPTAAAQTATAAAGAGAPPTETPPSAAATPKPAAASASSRVAPNSTAPRAGFWKNTAEYLANKMMQNVGVPQDQIKNMAWDPGGYMATSLGQGSATLAKVENDIAERLFREYHGIDYRTGNPKGTLNSEKVPLTRDNIAKAIQLVNSSESRLPIDINKAVNRFMQLLTKYKQATKQQQPQSKPAPGSTTAAGPRPAPAPAATSMSYPGGQPITPDDPVYKLAKAQGKI
jgi:hypothetical protein